MNKSIEPTHSWRNARKFKIAGQSLPEYALVAGLVAVVSIGALTTLGGNLKNGFDNLAASLGTSGGGGAVAVASVPAPSAGSGSLADLFSPPASLPADIVGTGTEQTEGQPAEEVPTTVSTTDPEPTTTTEPTPMTTSSQPTTATTDPAPQPATATASSTYQQWLANNPQTATMISQLSPAGQEAANQIFQDVANAGSGGFNSYQIGKTLLASPSLTSTDQAVINNYFFGSGVQVSSE